MALAIVIYLLPAESSQAKRKKGKRPVLIADPVAPEAGKDWKAIAERWEKNNQSLQNEIDKIKMAGKNAGQQLDGHKAEIKALTEKLALERSWHDKEQGTLEKFKHHEKDLKDQISRTENGLEKEHSNRLRLERELQDLRVKYDQIVEEKRQLSVKAASQQTTLEADAQELKELRSENTALKEKRAGQQWVAKLEFDELKKALQAKEQELERLKSHG